MKPRRTPSSNFCYELPGGTEDNYLWVNRGLDEDGHPVICSTWELTDADRQAIAAGANLEAIQKALDRHDANCEFPVQEIRMCHFERDRLGWEDYRGIPIVEDETMGTGRFRLICAKDLVGPEPEAVGDELDVPAEVAARGSSTREPILETVHRTDLDGAPR